MRKDGLLFPVRVVSHGGRVTKSKGIDPKAEFARLAVETLTLRGFSPKKIEMRLGVGRSDRETSAFARESVGGELLGYPVKILELPATSGYKYRCVVDAEGALEVARPAAFWEFVEFATVPDGDATDVWTFPLEEPSEALGAAWLSENDDGSSSKWTPGRMLASGNSVAGDFLYDATMLSMALFSPSRKKLLGDWVAENRQKQFRRLSRRFPWWDEIREDGE